MDQPASGTRHDWIGANDDQEKSNCSWIGTGEFCSVAKQRLARASEQWALASALLHEQVSGGLWVQREQ